MIKDNNYVNIQGWMVTQLGLKGNDLIVYAIIYGFSQDKDSTFKGSRQYLADWCNVTVRSIQNTLNNLMEMGLIKQTVHSKDNHNVEYAIIEPSEKSSLDLVKNFHEPSEKSSPYNIDNKLEEDNKEFISKDINLGKPTTTKKSSTEKEKKPNLYQKCLGMIEEYTEDKKLRELLDTYLRMRLSVKDKPLYGANQWKGLLNKLALIEGNDIEIVQYALERGYLSFYELPKYSANTTRKLVFGENEDNKSEKVTEEEIENGYFTESQF